MAGWIALALVVVIVVIFGLEAYASHLQNSGQNPFE